MKRSTPLKTYFLFTQRRWISCIKDLVVKIALYISNFLLKNRYSHAYFFLFIALRHFSSHRKMRSSTSSMNFFFNDMKIKTSQWTKKLFLVTLLATHTVQVWRQPKFLSSKTFLRAKYPSLFIFLFREIICVNLLHTY